MPVNASLVSIFIEGTLVRWWILPVLVVVNSSNRACPIQTKEYSALGNQIYFAEIFFAAQVVELSPMQTLDLPWNYGLEINIFSASKPSINNTSSTVLSFVQVLSTVDITRTITPLGTRVSPVPGRSTFFLMQGHA
jgi:hypothetical protein